MSGLIIHSLRAGIANVNLIDDGRGLVIVDSGWQGNAHLIMRHVTRYGYQARDVRLILLTHVHVDHAGSAAELRRLTGAPIAMHRGDTHIAQSGKHRIPTGRGWAGISTKWVFDTLDWELKFESFTPDIWLDQGQSLHDFGIEGHVAHTPGHTQGSVSLALEDGVILIGDALINMFKVSFPMYWEDPEAGRESAKKIRGFNPRILYSGHGRPFSGAELDRYFEIRERRIAGGALSR